MPLCPGSSQHSFAVVQLSWTASNHPFIHFLSNKAISPTSISQLFGPLGKLKVKSHYSDLQVGFSVARNGIFRRTIFLGITKKKKRKMEVYSAEEHADKHAEEMLLWE